ncbi:MAG: hypothetical protein SCH39_04340 [Methanosarcinales archaeon]|nr:hypothetical protein [Methanosarcinales archaeon]
MVVGKMAAQAVETQAYKDLFLICRLIDKIQMSATHNELQTISAGVQKY